MCLLVLTFILLLLGISTCRPPPSVHFTVNDSQANSRLPGSVVTYTCKTGYSSGKEPMQYRCSHDQGDWNRISDRIKCKSMLCWYESNYLHISFKYITYIEIH